MIDRHHGHRVALLASLILSLVHIYAQAEPVGVRETVWNVQERLLDQLSREALESLTREEALIHLSAEERHVLGTQFVRFTANVPVVVSVIRDPGPEPEFWLEDLGFIKTDLVVQSRHEAPWEVWQAEFPAGELSFPAFSFDLRLALPLLDESRDFDRVLLQLADNGRDPAGQVPGRCLSPLLGPFARGYGE